ncbi:DNA damage-binding protein 1a [Tieghemiomyces parasiticus]|uniref:DNA damage-binding protein 1a n=1 Tax=Tieghemiomyces parasiticus TaxID=78921 RepID=A0A9W8A7H1_9FUNG|nr:DNA damage-binding protein 1a [Tieghemiomyces parasiticus]
MAFNYVATAHKPTSIRHAIKGNFLSPDETNLILEKCTRIEILRLTPGGLVRTFKFSFNGRIASMQLFRPEGRLTDLLFIVTEKHQICVLSWDPRTHGPVTEATGDMTELVGQPRENGPIGLVDPACRAAVLHLYHGTIKVVPMATPSSLRKTGHGRPDPTGVVRSNALVDLYPYNPAFGPVTGKGKDAAALPRPGDLHNAFLVRIDEFELIDLVFLRDLPVLTLLTLARDREGSMQLKSYAVGLDTQELSPGPYPVYQVESGANLLIPLADGAVVIVGQVTLTYYQPPRAAVVISIAPNEFQVYARIDADDSRILLGDDEGTLFILILLRNGAGHVTDLKLQRLGTTTIASALVYLDDGYVYVGSHYGDSQLVRLSEKAVTPGQFVRVVDTYPNLAPIRDFCVVDTDRQGQGQMVACCGAYKGSTLRVIRNGVGIEDQLFIRISGAKRVWSARTTVAARDESFLAVGFANETRLLTLDRGELREAIGFTDFVSDQPTLGLQTVRGGLLAQTTAVGVRLLRFPHGGRVDEWLAPAKARVQLVSTQADRILLTMQSGWLVHLEIQGEKLVERSRRQLPHEIASLTLPIGGDPEAADTVSLCAVACWADPAVYTLTLPDLADADVKPLGTGTLVRSLALAHLDATLYLLVTLGDGGLHHFQCDPTTGGLSDGRQVRLGHGPARLAPFYTQNALHIFAAGDRPTVIYSRGRKLQFSNVNGTGVLDMCSFNSALLPQCIVTVSAAGLRVGRIDDIQKLHIRTIPLSNIEPRRICYQDTTGVFGLLGNTPFDMADPPGDDIGDEPSSRHSGDAEMGDATTNEASAANNIDSRLISSFQVVDGQSFDVVDGFRLQSYEQAESLVSAQLGPAALDYFIVGTAFVYPDAEDTKEGRLLVFRFARDQCKLELVAQCKVPGSVYSLERLGDRHFVAAINNCTTVFAWTDEREGGEAGPALREVCSAANHVVALYLTVRGWRIAVGDLMRSIAVLEFNPEAGTLVEVARDYHTNWMAAMEALDDQGTHYIGAEIAFNLFSVQVPPAPSATDNNQQPTVDGQLATTGLFHLGDFVNRFRPGALVMNLPDSHPVAQPRLLFGTVNGAIGVVATLDEARFRTLAQVERNLARVIRPVGGFPHDTWRRFANTQRAVADHGFIDGDLMEQFLDLSLSDMEAVVRGANGGTPLDISVEELTRTVEDLAKIY